MIDIVSELIAEAERIEREKNGVALTPGEAQTLQAVAFLRKIAPYCFEPDESQEGRSHGS